MRLTIRASNQLLRWAAPCNQALLSITIISINRSEGAYLVFVQLQVISIQLSSTFRVIKKVLDSDNSGSCLLF